MINKNAYLIKFADYLDKKNNKKEASYIDKLIIFLNRDSIEKKIMLDKKSKFKNTLIKLADSCDACGCHNQADMIDGSIKMLQKMPESYMAKKQVARIHEAARDLYDMIEEGEVLPDWVESKVAQIESMLSSVYKHIKYEKHEYEVQKKRLPKIKIV